jgi:hypothetical protein
VIGANWGQTHVRALRQHGVEVVALCGAPEDHERTTAVAAEFRIKRAVADPSRLLELDLDVVTVASPARSHAALVQLLAGFPVICEKPLLGMTGDPRRLPDDGARIWVNYAFTFLDSARRMAELGGVRAARVTSAYDLPLSFTPGEWAFEVLTWDNSVYIRWWATVANERPADCLRTGLAGLRVRRRHPLGLKCSSL